jgi:hypothetical protein
VSFHTLHVILMELISWPGLLQLLAKGWFICLLGLYLFRDMELSAAAARHRIAVGAMLCLAALPVLCWVAPAWQLPWLPRENDSAEVGAVSWSTALIWLYIIVALGMACRLLAQVVRIAIISMRSVPIPGAWREGISTLNIPTNVQLKESADISGTLTWGTLRPTILVPYASDHWSASERNLILRHELAHIARGDWMTVLLARWVCILYWPLPGLRSLFRHLSLSAEQACDDRVLAAGGNAMDYANVLLKQVRRERLPATLALAQHSELATRVRYLVAEIVDRSTLDPQRRWIFPLCILLAYPLATLSVVTEPNVLRVVALNRATHTALPASTAPITATTAAILKPEPPAAVLSPPPKLNLAESTRREGDKPSIPPPQR